MGCSCNNNHEEIDEYVLANFCRECGKKLEPEVRRDKPHEYDIRTGDGIYYWTKRCPDFDHKQDINNRHSVFYQERQEPGELPF